MAFAAPAFKAALVTALQTAFAADALVEVTYGPPAGPPWVSDDYVSVLRVGSSLVAATMATTRPREETLTATLVVSSYTGGGPEAQILASARAWALLATVDTALRSDPTVGGTVRKADITDADGADADDPDILAAGRVTEIVVTVTAAKRI